MKMAKRTEPDWKRLGAAATEAEQLFHQKKLTVEKWEALWKEAQEACNGNFQFLEAVENFRPAAATKDMAGG
jgi:hypothetical protein